MTSTYVAKSRLGRAAIAVSTGAIASAGLIALASAPASAGPARVQYTQPGSYSWTVPSGITAVSLTVYGAQGGTGWSPWADKYGVGGKGARVGTTFVVHGGQVLTVVVAGHGDDRQGGYGGGGAPGASMYDGAGGGGASRVSIDGKLLVVAGGGGGAAYGGVGSGVNGGDSGRTGGAASLANGAGGAGGFATMTSGGAAGSAGLSDHLPGCAHPRDGVPGLSGASGTGGAGADNIQSWTSSGGGGGGGGYLGGGGGGAGASCRDHSLTAPSGGGGGGSSYVDGSARGSLISDGVRAGDGAVVVDFQDNAAPVAAPILSPAANAYGWNNTDVTVSWSWSDQGTGIDAAHCQQADVRRTTPGIGTVSSSCADLSGNISRADQQVRIDKAAPTATWSIAADGYVAWHWSDDRSGIDRTSYCVDRSVRPAKGGTVSATCSDKAGNTATVSAVVS